MGVQIPKGDFSVHIGSDLWRIRSGQSYILESETLNDRSVRHAYSRFLKGTYPPSTQGKTRAGFLQMPIRQGAILEIFGSPKSTVVPNIDLLTADVTFHYPNGDAYCLFWNGRTINICQWND